MSTAMAVALDAKQDWNDRARQFIECLPSGQWVSADRLRKELPAAPHHNQYGAAIQAAARRGLISQGNYHRSDRKMRRGGGQFEWRRNEEETR